MTALLLEILASQSRFWLGALSTYLVTRGILTHEQGDRLIVEALKLLMQYGPGIVAMVWGARSVWMGRVKLKTALCAPAGSSEAHIEARIANGMGEKAT